jgi:hypothetical protein
LGIRDGGSRCFQNEPLIAAASYSALAVTIKWLHKHPIEFTWLAQPLLQTLHFFINPNITSLQQWNLQVATVNPSPDTRDKNTIPLQIPSPTIISEWPTHLFPTQGDFGRHIKKQLVTQFTRHLTVLQQQRYHSIARHTLQLSQSSHLLPNTKPAPNLWQCSTSFIWNPVPLDRIGQNGTYWYVPVRTSTRRYRAVQEFHIGTKQYVPVHTSTYFQIVKWFSDPPRKSQER